MKQELVNQNNDLQERWNTCIKTTCYAYRTVERIKEAINNLYEALRIVINNIVQSFKSFGESITLVLEEFKEHIYKKEEEEFFDKCKSFPHSFPHYVDNLKLNTRGFPQPIMRCARSRC